MDEGEIKAPRPRYPPSPRRPLESQELPPEFKLEETELGHDRKEELLMFEKGGMSTARKGSLDMHFSILGFITRKLRERSRQRVMSEDLLGQPL